MISDRMGSDCLRWWMASCIVKQSFLGIRPYCTGMRTLLVFAIAATLLAQTPQSNRPQQTKPQETKPEEDAASIKVDVDVVSILASVRDKRGTLIPNLEKQDFTIYEDGKPQEIKYFTKETDLPLTI